MCFSSNFEKELIKNECVSKEFTLQKIFYHSLKIPASIFIDKKNSIEELQKILQEILLTTNTTNEISYNTYSINLLEHN